MSYYDDPATFIHARIASEGSEIVNLRYSYNKVISKILSTPLEDLSVDLVQKQVQIINSLQERKRNILILESELTAFTQPATSLIEQLSNVEETLNTVVDTSISGELVDETATTNVVDETVVDDTVVSETATTNVVDETVVDDTVVSETATTNVVDETVATEYISSSTIMDTTDTTIIENISSSTLMDSIEFTQ